MQIKSEIESTGRWIGDINPYLELAEYYYNQFSYNWISTCTCVLSKNGFQ